MAAITAGTAGAVGVAPAKAAVAATGCAAASSAGVAGAASAAWTGVMPEDCGSTETVSGSGTVKPASLPAAVAVSVSAGVAFICEVDWQPLRAAAPTITEIAKRLNFAGKPRGSDLSVVKKSLHQRFLVGNRDHLVVFGWREPGSDAILFCICTGWHPGFRRFAERSASWKRHLRSQPATQC
ncbi:hypothetical protein [Mesorhizobium sp. L103C120A0]|uniref:hypothetical protein n=1 Tax=Mesorhizobium sp. L103C120A0 TaxID=1287086 RepID=UPI001FD92D76|nr:hypothetical protein [Mesorhizobium sp. L103C120A0]